jgi:hypothetical protein
MEGGSMHIRRAGARVILAIMEGTEMIVSMEAIMGRGGPDLTVDGMRIVRHSRRGRR